MTGQAGVKGAAPIVKVTNVRPQEKDIYKMMWDKPEYRIDAPGEQIVQHFFSQAQPKEGSRIIDFGCGTGRGALSLALLGGLDVTMVDFAPNCLDADIVPILDAQKHMFRFV